MSIPFHKQTDKQKQAGQVVFSLTTDDTSFERSRFMSVGHEFDCAQYPKQETTLAHYIERKQEGPKKITFDVWVDSMSKEFGNYSCYASYEGSAISLMECAWNAALTQGKL